MANRNKGYRNKPIDLGITFRDFVRGFCEYAETKSIFPCPECGQHARCNNTMMQDNFDVIGLFKCRCGHLFRKRVKVDEIRRQFAMITVKDIQQYDSFDATVSELEDRRSWPYAKQECCM